MVAQASEVPADGWRVLGVVRGTEAEWESGSTTQGGEEASSHPTSSPGCRLPSVPSCHVGRKRARRRDRRRAGMAMCCRDGLHFFCERIAL